MKSDQMHEKLIQRRTGYASLENYRKGWDKEDVRELERLFYEGYGISEIACVMNRSERAVFQRMNTSHLFRRTNQGKKSATRCLCEKCPLRETCSACPNNS